MAKDQKMITTEAELKAVAKAARASLARSGYDVPHTAVLNALAAALNRRDWNKLKAALAQPRSCHTEASAPAGRSAQEQSATREVEVYSCQNCGWETEDPSQLHEIEDLLERVAPGEPMPHGQCPECGALCHLEKRKLPAGTKSPAGPAFEGPEVPAKFWTDDRVCEVDFDARPYLVQATDRDLLSIIETGFTGDYATDAVAEFMGTLVPGIARGMDYLGMVQSGIRREPIGFECSVDRTQFMRWMDAHRKQTLAAFLCQRAGIRVRLIKDAEPTAGWTWEEFDSDGSEPVRESQGLLPTRETALLDAYEKCQLLERFLNHDI